MQQLMRLLKKFPDEEVLASKPRPYFNHSVAFKETFSAKKRLKKLADCGFNVFLFPSEMITGCDLLSDSGTTTMTNKQWAALHLGDEAYGSNKGYFLLLEQIREVFGEDFTNTFLFHQARPAEDALFLQIGKLNKGQIIPSNGHFDTTAANIEAHLMTPLNLFSKDLKDDKSSSHFKGNMDTEKLIKVLKNKKNNVPLVFLTITNNTGGGQPVSMENIKEVSKISRGFNIPLFFDACRFAENAWFIKEFEKGYKKISIKKIIKEMFSLVDGFTISFKKDGLVNMGGGIFIKKGGLFEKKYPYILSSLVDYQILKEGHPTYGGMSGRDIMTISFGLKTVVRKEYLKFRIDQVTAFGERMKSFGLPVLMPIGGHAVYLDMNKFFQDTKFKPEDFGGISFVSLLLGLFGHRACELGHFAFGHFDKHKNKEILPEVNFVRFAIPRLRYEKQDLESVAESAAVLYEKRNLLPKVKVLYGRDLPLRHFKAKFALSSS